jgi:predicted neutral ceramidase superfamily lipid hydrolase
MMKRCAYCAEDIQGAAIVCKHCNRSVAAVDVAAALNAPVPTAHLMPITVMLVGLFVMLAAATANYRLALLPGWLISWVGLGMVLKGISSVVRVGGGLIGSLLLMILAMSCR